MMTSHQDNTAENAFFTAYNDRLDLHWKWWNNTEILVMCGWSSVRDIFLIKQIPISNFPTSIYYLRFRRLSLLEFLDLFIFFPPPPSLFWILFFSPLLKRTTQESSGVLEPPGAEGLHVLFRVNFFQSLKRKSACRQFGFINQSVKDVTEIAGCRVRDGGGGGGGGGVGRKKKRQQRGIFLSLLRQNCRQCLYMNLATVDVLERRPWLLVRVETGSQSHWGVHIHVCYIFANIYQSVFCKLRNFLCRVESHWLPG